MNHKSPKQKKTCKQVALIPLTDKDAIESVLAFKQSQGYATSTEAISKLINRAVRAGFHLLDNDEYEQFLAGRQLTAS